MSGSIDELYARWQRNPTVAETVALCDALRAGNRSELVDVVGSHAARGEQIPALLAAARMYSDLGRLEDAQTTLLSAGRIAPRDGNVYRWLGEVLLRRGDAERAEKVLERALLLGTTDAEANFWLGRARALIPTQRASGLNGVAAQIARSMPPVRPTQESDSDVETQIRKGADIRSQMEALLAPAIAPGAIGPLPAPTPPPLSAPPPPLVAPSQRPPPPALEQPFTVPLGFQPVMRTQPPAMPAPIVDAISAPPAMPPPPRRPELAVNPMLLPSAGIAVSSVPEPRDVLDALQIAGIFEPDGAVKPQAFSWDKPEKGKRRVVSYVFVVGLAVLAIGGGTGAFYWINAEREKNHIAAETLLGKLDADLRSSDAKLLPDAEKGIGKAFDLDSRSPHAALTWLHERAMLGLLGGGGDVAFEDATSRAQEVGIPDSKIAFARVASFLFQNDTAGAAAAIAKWDQAATDDPWFQMIAGATFERAGDPRAAQRYGAAVKLDPDLVMAEILLVRATAVDGDPRAAGELARSLRGKRPDRPETAALVALAWARDPMRGDAPPEARQIVEHDYELPIPLRAVPQATRAILALEQRKPEDAKPALQKGLALADTPGVAAWLGGIALATGDEALARKAALAAVSFSAVYPPARVLAARVALLGARLDEALKAAEDLPPSSPDVAVVTAAVAYEKIDPERMSRALDAMGDDAKRLPFVIPLLKGQALLGGSAAPPGALDDDAPWADLVTMDQALDVGDLDSAEKIAGNWRGDPRPLRALRLARLARYQGKNEEADRLGRFALDGSTVTPRVLAERVFTLVAMNHAGEALALFKTYPNVGGAQAKWLRAYALASSGKVEEAKAILAQDDPPSALAPLPTRIYAAAAYGATKDVRHGADFVKGLAALGIGNPDVDTASDKLGGGRVAHKR